MPLALYQIRGETRAPRDLLLVPWSGSALALPHFFRPESGFTEWGYAARGPLGTCTWVVWVWYSNLQYCILEESNAYAARLGLWIVLCCCRFFQLSVAIILGYCQPSESVKIGYNFFRPVSSVDSDLQGILYLFFFGFRNLCSPPSALLALLRCFHKLPLARMGAAQAPSLFVCLGLFVLLRLYRRCRRTTVRPFLRSLSYPLSLHESRYIRFHI